MKHCIQIQTNNGANHYQAYANSIEAAKTIASLAFAGGAARCWVDGVLVAGPMGELLADEPV